MCVYKAADAIEDVYHGMFQQKERLDIAAKSLTIRTFITIIVFVIGLVLLKKQTSFTIHCDFSNLYYNVLFFKCRM